MKYLVSILLLAVLLVGCREKAPKPGTERFYCLVNGKSFRPHNGGDIFNHPVYAEWDTRGWFNLYGSDFSKTSSHNITMSAKLKNVYVEAGTYSIGDKDYFANYYGEYFKTNNDSNSVKQNYKGFDGTLIITKYIKGESVSGTFEFKAKSIYTNEIVHITKGQFNDVTVYQVY